MNSEKIILIKNVISINKGLYIYIYLFFYNNTTIKVIKVVGYLKKLG